MTPEERAEALVDEVRTDLHPRGAAALEREISAAIREAVDAETEACARIVCRRCQDGEAVSFTRGTYAETWCHGVYVCRGARIRQRAASRAKPAQGDTP